MEQRAPAGEAGWTVHPGHAQPPGDLPKGFPPSWLPHPYLCKEGVALHAQIPILPEFTVDSELPVTEPEGSGNQGPGSQPNACRVSGTNRL